MTEKSIFISFIIKIAVNVYQYILKFKYKVFRLNSNVQYVFLVSSIGNPNIKYIYIYKHNTYKYVWLVFLSSAHLSTI